MAGGTPLSAGRWDVQVNVAAWGLESRSALVRAPSAKAAVTRTPSLFGASAIKVVPEIKKPKPGATVKTLRLRVGSTVRLPIKLLLRRVRQLTITAGGDLAAAIDVTIAPDGPPATVGLILLDADDAVVATRTGDISLTPIGSRLTSQLIVARDPLPAGRLRIAVKSGRRVRLLGAIKVGQDGRVAGVEARQPKPISIPASRTQAAAPYRPLIRRRITADVGFVRSFLGESKY
jgi:hypothetical protein